MSALQVVRAPMPVESDVVFLLDVDNTLLDNDRIVDDLRVHLDARFGAAPAALYWGHFEALRSERGYADYLGALQRWRTDMDECGADANRLLGVSQFLLDYPFAERLYPGALDVVARLNAIGTTVILSDGDVVFQPRKVARSGLWQAVGGRVQICVHKERMLTAVQRRFPARRYLMVEDKPRILKAMKAVLGARLVTVFVRQGHYALDPASDPDDEPARRDRGDTALFAAPAGAPFTPDCTVQRIGDMFAVDIDALLRAAPALESA